MSENASNNVKSDTNATASNCDGIHTALTAQDSFDDLDCDPMLLDMAYTLERERNSDDPEIKTNDMFTKMLWRIETHTLNLYKKRLVECYRIYLTTKYPSQFETYRKTLEKNYFIKWCDLYSEFPEEFKNNQFLSIIQNFALTYDDIYNLQKDEINQIRRLFAERNVDKIWFDMAEFVDEHFDDIEKQRNNLRNMNLIMDDSLS